MKPKISQEAKAMAAQCRHYAMCKIDYLETGLCPAGVEKPYVSYFPQGRMDLCHALSEGLLRLTPALVDIVEYAKKMFGLRGIEACRTEAFKEKARNGLEVLFDTYLEAYGPYMRDARVFATDASGPFLEKHALVSPEFDYELFSKCMSYAVESGWGALLFPI